MVHIPTSTGKPAIAVVGAGRAGSTLARALHAAGYPITAVWSRNPDHAAELASAVNAPVAPQTYIATHAVLTLIAVSDDSLAGVVEQLADSGVWRTGASVAHCSGVHAADALASAARHGAKIGAFHPLLAIASHTQALPPGTTFAVEAEEPLRGLLHRMAHDLQGYAVDLRPQDRALYHAAAVLASNYTVVLAALAQSLLGRIGIDNTTGLRALQPLLGSTLTNLQRQGLPAALTGPLVRGDTATVARHLAALEVHAPSIAHVYRTLGLAALPLVAERAELDDTQIEKLTRVLNIDH